MVEPNFTGTTNTGRPWTAGVLKVNYFLKAPAWEGQDVLQEKIPRSIMETLIDLPAVADAFLSAYAGAPTSYTKIHNYLQLRKISAEALEAIKSLEVPAQQLLLFKLAPLYKNASKAELLRLAHLALYSHQNVTSYTPWSSFSDLAISHKHSLMESLDLIHFFTHGAKDETYEEFTETHGGLYFFFDEPSIKRVDVETKAGPQVKLPELMLIVRNFAKYTNGPKMVRDKLYSMTTAELLAVLNYNYPSDLFAADLVEIFEAEAPRPLSSDSASQLLSINPKSKWSKAATSELALHGLEESYEAQTKKLRFRNVSPEKHYAEPPHVLFSFAVSKLGAAEALRLCMTLLDQEEKPSTRGFVELVRRGGFGADDFPAWVIPLLP